MRRLLGFFTNTFMNRAKVAETDNSIVPDLQDQVLCHIVLCNGCCCSYSDTAEDSRSEVSLKDFKQWWKELKLNKAVRLTISGCQGLCTIGNNCLIISPSKSIWLSELNAKEDLEELLHWAERCKESDKVIEIPKALQKHRIRRFRS